MAEVDFKRQTSNKTKKLKEFPLLVLTGHITFCFKGSVRGFVFSRRGWLLPELQSSTG